MIVLLTFYLLVIPLCTLMHEVGHGLGVVLISNSRAHIHMGGVNERDKQSFRMGRLHFHIKWSYYGFCSTEGNLSKKQRLVNLIGGPLMSLIMAIIFGLLMLVVSKGDVQTLLSGTASFCAISFLVTAVPIKYPRWMGLYNGHPSDGLQVLILLRG